MPKGSTGVGLPLAARLSRRIVPASSVLSNLPAQSSVLISTWDQIHQRENVDELVLALQSIPSTPVHPSLLLLTCIARAVDMMHITFGARVVTEQG